MIYSIIFWFKTKVLKYKLSPYHGSGRRCLKMRNGTIKQSNKY